jgi:hypothetical protein
LKGVLKEDLGDALANDKVKYIYSLNNEAIAELEDSLSIPIYSNGSDILLVFPPVGVNVQGSGPYVAQFRSSFFDIDLRGNSEVEVVEKIDLLLVDLLPLKAKVRSEFPDRIIKAVVILLFESTDSKFKERLLKIASSRTSQAFFEDFENRYSEISINTDWQVARNDFRLLLEIIAFIDEPYKTPKTKRDLIKDVIAKAESLNKSLDKGGAEPNIYDLINFAAKSSQISNERQATLSNMSSRLWGYGANLDFPTLTEVLTGYVEALNKIDIEKQKGLQNCFLFLEQAESKDLFGSLLQKDFDTLEANVRYDRRVFTFCELFFGKIPKSLSRIFDTVFNNGRDFVNSKKTYRTWKRDKK